MPLHFTDAEMRARLERGAQAIREAGFDALLLFKQESMYWLTGYDTFGFALFQCLVITADGRTALLTRAPDLVTAKYTSNITDIRIWKDVQGKNPAKDLRAMLADMDLKGSCLGIELDSYGLTAANYRLLERELLGFAAWQDASTVIQELRRTKSKQELAYIGRAAQLADLAWEKAVDLAAAGVSEARILAAMQGAVLEGGGDYAGNEMIIGSGPAALMVRYTSGRRTLDTNDQLTLEWCGVQRRYHAAMMRTMLIGKPDPSQIQMHRACEDALLACEEIIAPGRSLGEVFDVHAKVLDAAGFGLHRLNACGYGMGAVYAPIWVDWPMLYRGNPLLFDKDQVYFLHMILLNQQTQQAMTLGHSVVVTAHGCARLSKSSLDLVIH